MTEKTPQEKAELLVAEIRAALDAGVRHFAHDGRFLPDAKSILEELSRNLSVNFKVPAGQRRPTYEVIVGGETKRFDN